jgi:drug/metabolite transporter (DMT)-like permease
MDKRIIYIAYPCFVLSGTAVNFLLKAPALHNKLLGLAQVVFAAELNGLRLILAGLVLLAVALTWRVDLGLGRYLWRCALVGLLMMAVPQGLLFYALSRTATANTAAFAEATIPGIVLIYLCVGRWRLERTPLLCVAGALTALMVFLYNEPTRGAGGTGDIVLVLFSAAVTAFGLVLSRILPKPTAPGLQNKLKNSLSNNVYMICSSGVATLAFVAAITGTFRMMTPASTAAAAARMPAADAWPPLLALALVGACLGWISLFLLLTEDMVLACSAIIAIPIVTALVSAVGVGGGKPLTPPQWPSAIVVVGALSILLWIKLRKGSKPTLAEVSCA